MKIFKSKLIDILVEDEMADDPLWPKDVVDAIIELIKDEMPKKKAHVGGQRWEQEDRGYDQAIDAMLEKLK